MKKSSGVKFSDRRRFSDFEAQLAADAEGSETVERVNNYTVYTSANSVLLEFPSMDAVAHFLETSRNRGLLASTFRIAKVISVKPAEPYFDPQTEKDRWAVDRIKQVVYENPSKHTCLFTAGEYQKLKEDLQFASITISEYVC